MGVSNSPRLHHENHPFSNNLQHKVSHKDSRPCRQASQRSELMLYQQLRKANRIEVTSRVVRPGVQHLNHVQHPKT